MTLFTRLVIALALFAGMVAPAAAYIGPGAGLSLLGALWGLLVAIGASLLFVIAWPFRRLLRGKRSNAQGKTTADDHSDDTPGPGSQ